jgi:hypothetical protein
MAVTIALILVAMFVLTALELWALWALGERDDRRRQLARQTQAAAGHARDGDRVRPDQVRTVRTRPRRRTPGAASR